MFIIIEGPTAAGKSTLIHELVAVASSTQVVHALHNGQPEELTRRWVLDQYVLSVDNWYTPSGAHGHIVADRWAWGELTYAPVYRPSTDFDGFGLLGQAGWRWVEMFLQSRGALTVHVTADLLVLAARLASRGDDHVTNVDGLRKVKDLYDQVVACRLSSTLGVTYDTTHVAHDPRVAHGMVAGIIALASSRAVHAHRVVTAWPEYIGPREPTALLVGDVRNEGRDRRWAGVTRLPFMPINGNSGDYLLNALSSHLWQHVGLVNGNDVGDRLEGLWEALGHPHVVALGARAARAVAEAGIDQEHVSTTLHPQYVRRFKYTEIDQYRNVLDEAAYGGEIDPAWQIR